MISPKRWHLYIVNLEPRVGTKPGKHRPCICIQPTEFCAAGLPSAVILPLTTNTKKNALPLRVPVPKGTCGLNEESDVLVDQILAWDVALFKEDKGEIPEGLQKMINVALSDFLDL